MKLDHSCITYGCRRLREIHALVCLLVGLILVWCFTIPPRSIQSSVVHTDGTVWWVWWFDWYIFWSKYLRSLDVHILRFRFGFLRFGPPTTPWELVVSFPNWVVVSMIFYFHPRKLGKMNPFWLIFFKGLKPPTSLICVYFPKHRTVLKNLFRHEETRDTMKTVQNCLYVFSSGKKLAKFLSSNWLNYLSNPPSHFPYRMGGVVPSKNPIF